MTHKPRTTDIFSSLPQLIALANLSNHLLLDDHAIRLQAETMQLAKHHQYLHHQFLHSLTTDAPAASSDPSGTSFEAAVDVLCTALPTTTENLGLGLINSQPLLQVKTNGSQWLSQLSVGPHPEQEAVSFSSLPTPQLSCDLAQLFNDNISLLESAEGFFTPNPPAMATDTTVSNLGNAEVSSTTTSCGGGSASPPDWLADYNF